MNSIKRILVLSRMNQDSRKAINFGIALARKHGATLVAIHFVSNAAEMSALNAPDMFPLDDFNNYMIMQQSAQENLEKIIQDEIRLGFPIQEVISEGVPVEETIKMVKEEKIDLLILSAHEEGRIEHAFFGGENDDLIRRMPCSILLVKDEPESVDN